MQPLDDRLIPRLLWFLQGLFLARVIGQILVQFWGVEFLPPSSEWYSGVVDYPPLLLFQLTILGLQTWVNVNFTQRAGFFAGRSRRFGKALVVFGAIYLLVMVTRYALRMTLYPLERWSGGSIPIFFHWVLASYCIAWGLHTISLVSHQRTSPFVIRWRRLRVATGSAISLVLIGCYLGWVCYLAAPAFLVWKITGRVPLYAVRIEAGRSLETEDGTKLVADLYHPIRAGIKSPTILVRLNYTKTAKQTLFARLIGRSWAEQGFTVVLQGTRGRYESEGEYVPFRHERRDGQETLSWLSQQPWFNGKVGTWGGSYFGYTQWAIADNESPPLSAMYVYESSTDFFRTLYRGGAFGLQSALWWANTVHFESFESVTPELVARGASGFPVIEADDRSVSDVGFYNDWASHRQRDAFWQQVDGTRRSYATKAPVLLLAGWYDPFLQTQLDDFKVLHSHADASVSKQSRLIIGPWGHAKNVFFPDGSSTENFRFVSIARSFDWFDRHLKGRKGVQTSPVRIFVMGDNRWRDEQTWPLPRAVNTKLFLQSDGNAADPSGDGQLLLEAPSDTHIPDVFTYNPLNPVPTRGGAFMGPGMAIKQQNTIELRPDVLSYTSSPLAENVEVTGYVHATLFVSTDAASTDFTAKLVDVYPDGSAYNIADGILRQPYDVGDQRVSIVIQLGATSNVFQKGHRIRLDVSSSNFPLFDRNPNTGTPIAFETRAVASLQKIHHDASTPSFVELPIVPVKNGVQLIRFHADE